MFSFSPLCRYSVIGGRRRLIEVVFTGDELHYDLSADLQSNFAWNGTDAIDVLVTIPSGMRAYATSATTPAFTVSSLFQTTGSTVRLRLEGTLDGAGGLEGAAQSNGQMGGTALYTRSPISIVNLNAMRGGGGGGGGGGNARGGVFQFGEVATCESIASANGGSGGRGQGGQGAAQGGSSGGPLCNGGSGDGGNGGGFGQPGNNGAGGDVNAPCNCSIIENAGGSGGPAGRYVDGFSFVTWIATGTRLGTSAN